MGEGKKRDAYERKKRVEEELYIISFASKGAAEGPKTKWGS